MFAGIPRLVSMAKLLVSHRHLCDVGADLVELRLASQDQLCHLLFGTPAQVSSFGAPWWSQQWK